MQIAAGVGAESNHIPCVGWNFRGNQNDVKHENRMEALGAPWFGQWSGLFWNSHLWAIISPIQRAVGGARAFIHQLFAQTLLH